MSDTVQFEERVVVGNVIEEVVAIGKSWEYGRIPYGLVVACNGRLPSATVAELAVHPAEHPDMRSPCLATSSHSSMRGEATGLSSPAREWLLAGSVW